MAIVPRTTRRVPRGVILATSFRNSLLATTSHNGKVAVGGATSASRYDNQIRDIFMKRCVPLTLFFLTTLLATPGFCQQLRPVTLGLTGKSLTPLIFEMSIRRGN